MAGIQAVLQKVSREVWIVTAAHQSQRGGLTATWISQASLDPERPLLVAGLAVNHFTCELVIGSGRLTAHLLSDQQANLAWQFASSSGRDSDKFAGLRWSNSPLGTPRLDDCPAWLDCRVIEHHDTGDRRYFWAEIVDGQLQHDFRPLTDHQLFASGTPAQLQAAKLGLQLDLEIQRPLAQAWRQGLAPRPSERS